MRSDHEFVQDILKQVRSKRKNKRITVSLITFSIVAFLCFLIGYSNIISFTFDPYESSYNRYLCSYVCAREEDVRLRFVDEKNAIVTLEENVYPCALKALSKKEFKLTVIQANAESPLSDMSSDTAESTPSVFNVEFWEQNATISWTVLGVKIEKVLSISEDWNIPAGLWSLFAT